MDQYYVLKVIGAGREGRVLQCQHKKTGEIVAVKRTEIPLDRLEQANAILEEAHQIIKLPKHGNLIEYRRVFLHRYPTSNLCFVCTVMEFCSRGDFAEQIRRETSNFQKQMKQEKILRYLLQILNGVNFLHENNLIHRDLKPKNILLSEDMTIKIGDFGMLRKLNENSLASTQNGTPFYMAPEIMNNQYYDEKCDLYSIGMILLELFCGTPKMLVLELSKNAHYFETLFKEIVSDKKYNEELFYLMKNLLSLNPRERPSATECIKRLKRIMHATSTPFLTTQGQQQEMIDFAMSTQHTTKIFFSNFQLLQPHRPLLLHILSFLEFFDLYYCMQVNKLFYITSNDATIWKAICHFYLGEKFKPFHKQSHFLMRQHSIEHHFSTNTKYKQFMKNYILYEQMDLEKRKRHVLGKSLVREILPEQLEEAAYLLAEAYQNNPTFRYIVTGQITNQEFESTPPIFLETISSTKQHSSTKQVSLIDPILNESNTTTEMIVSPQEIVVQVQPPKKQPKLKKNEFQILLQLMKIILEHTMLYGRIFVLTQYDKYNSSQIQAISLWQPPFHEKISCIWKYFAKQIVKFSLQLHSSFVVQRFIKVFKEQYKLTQTELLQSNSQQQRSWMLFMMGVLPQKQREGLGGVTCSPVFKMAEDSNLPCIVVSTCKFSVTFFERHGFEIVKQYTVSKEEKQLHHEKFNLNPKQLGNICIDKNVTTKLMGVNNIYLFKRLNDIHVNAN